MVHSPSVSDGQGGFGWQRGQSTWSVGFLHTYPITMFLGVLLAFFSIVYFWKRQKYPWEVLQILIILVIPGAIIGARLWFLIAEGGWDKWYILSGLSIQGGVLGALLAGLPFIYSRRHVVDVRTVIGIVMPNVILGQAIGRWGNFANHEVFGRVTSSESLDWMGALKSHMYISISGGQPEYRQPLFFYEFMTSIAGYILIVLVLLRKNWVKPGVTAAIYLLWYGIIRSAMEPLRDPVDIMTWGKLPISVFMSVVMIVSGLGLGIWWQFLSKRKYDLIRPIKERRLFLFGNKSDMKKKYVFFGEELPNRVNIWLPNDEENHTKWSKREINAGEQKKTAKNWFTKPDKKEDKDDNKDVIKEKDH